MRLHPVGLAILGYLGYHAVRWIINKCHKTKKIDCIAQKTIGSVPPIIAPKSTNLEILPLPLKEPNPSDKVQLDEVALGQKSEKQKILAATKIQSLYRGHVARLTLKKLQDENLKKQESAVIIKIQPQSLSETGGKAAIGIATANPSTGINQVEEKFDKDGRGYRIFSNGTKEWGRLDKEKQFICAYRIDSNKSTLFIEPEELIKYHDKSSGEYIYESVTEFEGELIVLEEIFRESGHKSHYVLGKKTPLATLVWNAATEAYSIPDAKNLKKVLNHKGFAEHLPGFIEKALTLDEFEVPRLFALPEKAIIEIMVSGEQKGLINPLSVGNLFIHAACSKNYKLIEKLAELFPDIFQSIAEEVIEKLITCGYLISDVQNLIMKMNKKPDYYDLWLEIATGKQPKQGFDKEFTTLSSKHQKLLYQAAFAYNNIFLHEPADLPITPEQYSINLMWINKSKIPVEQEFLFGDGTNV